MRRQLEGGNARKLARLYAYGIKLITHMPGKRPDPKVESLRARGTLHPNPGAVRDQQFQRGDFFDPRDLMQTKYEMLRKVRVDGATVAGAAAAFGLSRPTFYEAQAALDRDGLAGLLPRKRGPQRAHKLTDKVVDFMESEQAKNRSLRARHFVPLIKERFGIDVHPRSIERALGRRKKKRL